MKKQLVRILFSSIIGTAVAVPALADERAQDELSGFYGGLSMRERGSESEGIQFGHLSSVWNKFTLPVTEYSGARALAFGGYRWTNDLALEAAVGTNDRLVLHPDSTTGGRGMGLALANGAEAAPRSWNVDLYTTWGFAKSFSFYGRLGYLQNDAASAYAGTVLTSDGRRNRDGVNYGVGLRYDVNRALGLRLEYARFGRGQGDTVNGVLPDSDQVQLGLQFRF
jgi:opacity protein-like surface antigen